MLIWAISGKYTYPLSVTLEDREPMVFFRKGQIANFGKKTPQVQRKTPQEILIIPPLVHFIRTIAPSPLCK